MAKSGENSPVLLQDGGNDGEEASELAVEEANPEGV